MFELCCFSFYSGVMKNLIYSMVVNTSLFFKFRIFLCSLIICLTICAMTNSRYFGRNLPQFPIMKHSDVISVSSIDNLNINAVQIEKKYSNISGNHSRFNDLIRKSIFSNETSMNVNNSNVEFFSDYLFGECYSNFSSTMTFYNVYRSQKYGFIGPFQYLSNYKNPCWRRKFKTSTVVSCVPYFYLIGSPKSGSTDVYKRITMHPEVVMPVAKETRWWDRERFKDKHSFSHFLVNFEHASTKIARSMVWGTDYHHLVVGDGSPSYFFDNRQWMMMPGNEHCIEPRVTVASYVHHLYPAARILVVFRNPVDRLYSSYLFNHAKYERVSRETFHDYASEAVRLYNECFMRFSVRQCANNATLFSQSKVMLIVSLYGVFLHDWIKLFGRHRIFVMTTERYHDSMATELGKIYKFLDLRQLDDMEMSTVVRHGIYNRGHQYTKTGKMLNETRKMLLQFYRPYNRELVSMFDNFDLLWLG